MQKLKAIVWLTIKEAYRKKVFAVIILFAIALVSSSAFFPVITPESKLRLVEIWSIRAISFFAALVAVFIAGVSIPSDIEEKRIYTLASKPLSKTALFLGKYVGFTLVIGFFILVMGIITIGYIRITQLSVENVKLIAKPKILKDEIKTYKAEMREKDGEILYGLFGSEYNVLGWHFSNLKTSHFSENIEIEIKLNITHSNPARWDVYAGHINVAVYNLQKVYKEKHFLRSNVPYKILLPLEFITKSGELFMEISRTDPSNNLVAAEESVILYGKSELFELNYIKGLLLIFFQSAIILTASMMASSFLSAPISIFFGLFIYFCGSVHGFVTESLVTVGKAIEVQKARFPGQGHYHRQDEIPVEVLEVSKFVSKIALVVVPNLDKFDFYKFILKDLAVPIATLCNSFLYAGIFIIIMLGLGLLLIIFRDFG